MDIQVKRQLLRDSMCDGRTVAGLMRETRALWGAMDRHEFMNLWYEAFEMQSRRGHLLQASMAFWSGRCTAEYVESRWLPSIVYSHQNRSCAFGTNCWIVQLLQREPDICTLIERYVFREEKDHKSDVEAAYQNFEISLRGTTIPQPEEKVIKVLANCIWDCRRQELTKTIYAALCARLDSRERGQR